MNKYMKVAKELSENNLKTKIKWQFLKQSVSSSEL